LAVRFSEFSLTLTPPFRQTELLRENPLCRLAARTTLGACVCNQGCGMDHPAEQTGHTCPFGLAMRRVPAPSGLSQERWIGRRFPNVRAMHQALDQLIGEGLDEETILAHLPPNPIASEEELKQATLHEDTPVVNQTSIQGTQENFRLGNLLEYLEQVHSLIATANRSATICERFLRVVAAVAPFDEMAIYLREDTGADWVIASSVDCLGASLPQPRPQACRLEPAGAGAAAIAQHRMIVQRDGQIESFHGEFQGPGMLAIPFPLGSGNVLGVWLASQCDPARVSPLGGDLARFMRLLAELLAARLQQVAPRPAAANPSLAPAVQPQPKSESQRGWNRESLLEALRPEVARAAREGGEVALLCLQVASTSPSRQVHLPKEALTQELARTLRPYDRIALCCEPDQTWGIILPHAREDNARIIAARLQSVFEDFMDACGGMEEQGLQSKVGVSIWSADATSAEQMIDHAFHAARQGFERADNAMIRLSDSRPTTVGPMAVGM
jgi:GGDEF domain-containing protein